MLIVQCIGECVGLFLAPATFFLFYKVSQYKCV